MTSPELIKYIKKGLEKGFSPEHISSVLEKHGHHPNNIRLAMNKARLSYPKYFEEPSLRQLEGKNYVPMLYLAIVVLVIISVSAITYNLIVVQEKDQQIELTANTVKEKVDELNQLSTQIDTKQKTIDEQLTDIERLGDTINDRDKLIEEQIKQLREVNDMMKKERDSVRSMLLDLINSIMNK